MTSCHRRRYNVVFLFVFFGEKNVLLSNCIVLIYCGCSVKQKFELKIYCLESPDLSFTRTSFKLGAVNRQRSLEVTTRSTSMSRKTGSSYSANRKKIFGRRQISAQHRESARVTPPLVLLSGAHTSFKIKVRCRR